MKRKVINTTTLCVAVLLLGTTVVKAQQVDKRSTLTKNLQEEDDGPVIFKFEPNLFSHNANRSSEIAQAKAVIDTMDISDRKRSKLLKELYRNAGTKATKKELYADVKFEDVD